MSDPKRSGVARVLGHDDVRPIASAIPSSSSAPFTGSGHGSGSGN